MMLSHTEGRVVIKVDVEWKNQHTFQSTGLIIRHERKYNNLNKRETEPVNAFCVSGDNIPEGAEILIHHNSTHPVAEIFNHKPLSGDAIADTVKYFSIPETQCYLWRKNSNEKWMPLNGFATALRVFEPVRTQFYGIAPNLIKNTLYITSGELSGTVVRTLKASDYEVVFRNEKGVEERVIRLRHFPNEHSDREEITSLDHAYTERVNSGDLYIGISVTDAKPIDKYFDKKEESKLII